jgi:hypothetical protein
MTNEGQITNLEVAKVSKTFVVKIKSKK